MPRWQLKSPESVLLPISMLGLISGLLAGGIIVIFRLSVEYCQSTFLTSPENYESLSMLLRFFIPFSGALLVGLLLQWVSPSSRSVGVVHVIERLNYHQGKLPLKNALTQFVGAGICLISGHSVGREGPSIHLGAAGAGSIGSYFDLPNTTTRTLVGCGTAAAIAASFNTPLAGVIFAMEVVMMEYTIIGFIPVILAAVSATTLSRLTFGHDPVFMVPPLSLGSLAEIPYMIVVGITIGILASLFIKSLLFFTQIFTSWAIWQRTTLAGLILGAFGLFIPEVLGMGYDTVNSTMLGELSFLFMAVIVVAKLLATTCSLGLGLPGGLIGPTMVIGASAGGALGMLAQIIYGDQAASHGFYALIGMATMMGATIHAPLAALISILELTANTHVILPSMLAIVTASIINSEVFKQNSIFRHLMLAKNLDYRNDPITQSLRRIDVAKVMDRQCIHINRYGSASQLKQALQDNPTWIVINEDHTEAKTLLQASDLVRYLRENDGEEKVDLQEIPATRMQLGDIYWQATMQEAYDLLENPSVEALFVYRLPAPGMKRIEGIVTDAHVTASYRI